ncbi:hypothetical protein GCM10007874_12730 [Labrys miyagiensis]|uniref:DUF2721 domain-containing protein n=1 Tax=Labrys miyagiensis TaxID=346912 RepID=A0ABQ6CD22_9HYPH|nr:DUF2721 domain-containing protein [Labrys miyagiensis]GLS18257.1 hypothetical protein GCM10007874_12730 [Labrys miyagiensis]
MLLTPDVAQLSQIFSHAAAPAFLLGAVAGFTSILHGRLVSLLERIRTLNEIDDGDDKRHKLKADLPRLRRRVKLLSGAIYLALCAAICTTLLLAVSFIAAFFGFQHELGAAAMFLLAVLLLATSLFRFAQEIQMGVSEADHFR